MVLHFCPLIQSRLPPIVGKKLTVKGAKVKGKIECQPKEIYLYLIKSIVNGPTVIVYQMKNVNPAARYNKKN